MKLGILASLTLFVALPMGATMQEEHRSPNSIVVYEAESYPTLQQNCDSAFENGDYATVLVLCPEIRESQDLPYLLSYEAVANAELGRMPEALEKLVRLVDVTNAGADAYMALTRVADKDLGATVNRLSREEKIDNQNPVWPESLGVIYAYYNLYNDAIDCYLRALSLNPSNDADADALAMLYNQLRRYREALSYAELALQLNPDDYSHAETRALVMRNSGDIDGAEQYLSSMIGLDADYAPLYIWRGTLRSNRGDYALAADDFNNALLRDSLGNEAKLRLAISEFDMGNLSRAEHLFRTVADNSSHLWSGNALACAYLGEKERVEAYREYALEQRRKANYYFTLAALSDIEGDSDAAFNYLRSALAENVLNPDIIDYDSNLRNVKQLAAYKELLDAHQVKARE